MTVTVWLAEVTVANNSIPFWSVGLGFYLGIKSSQTALFKSQVNAVGKGFISEAIAGDVFINPIIIARTMAQNFFIVIK